MKDCAEILCVGTEILLGNIVNTNSAEISRGLAEIGIDMYHHTVVGDNPQRLKEALDIAFERNNMVITTGGLGPTYDDLTKETIADYFGLPLEPNAGEERRLRDFFARRGRPMTENNLKQAMLPRGCMVLQNPNGTAPGAIVEGGGKVAVMLPGPPREMLPMFRDQVMPWLEKRSRRVFRSHCVYFYGIGESALEARLKDKMAAMENPTLAPYAKDGEVMLRVTASAPSEGEAEAMMEPVIGELMEQFPEYIYGVDVDNLQTAAVEALRKKGLVAATAESCTGGLVSKRITEVPGSSEVFGWGVVAYANQAKVELLGVRPETLRDCGAVSPQTAAEMAEGVRRLSGADVGVSVTGVAGPEGGTEEKPVGRVYVGLSSPWYSHVSELNLGRGSGEEREYIRFVAASKALSLLLRAAEKK